MEAASHEEYRGLSRRGLLRKGLVVGLGAAGLSVVSSALTAGTALAGVVNGSTGTAEHGGETVNFFDVQDGWRCCGLCFNLYFLANGGHCVGTANASDPHQPYTGDTDYGVCMGGVTSVTSVQSPWRYCSWCASLYYGPDESSSHCGGALGWGSHNTGGTTYYLPYDSWTPVGTPTLQPGWRFCAKCKVLFWPGQIANSNCAGLAASGFGPHVTIGSVASATNYNLFM